MVDVVDHEPLELALIPDDRVVRELSAQGADPAFSEGVGHWDANRGAQYLETFASEDLVEVVDELAGTVTNEGSGVGEPAGMTHEEVAGGLGGPGACGVGGDGAVEDFAVGDVDEEQQVTAAQQGGVDGYEVAGNGGLGAQELRPGHTRALRGGVEAVLFEDSPHSGGSNAVTEANEFAGNAALAPRRVAGSHLDDETTQLHRGAGPAGRPAGLGPVAGDSPSVPTQQRLWCDEPASSLRSRQGRRNSAQQGPVLVGEGWTVVQAVQHCELVTQHDDLKVLRTSRAHSQAGQRHEQPIQNATHGTPACRRIMPGQRTRPYFGHPHASTVRSVIDSTADRCSPPGCPGL